MENREIFLHPIKTAKTATSASIGFGLSLVSEAIIIYGAIETDGSKVHHTIAAGALILNSMLMSYEVGLIKRKVERDEPSATEQTHNISQPIFFRLTEFGDKILDHKLSDEVSLKFAHTYPKDKPEMDRQKNEARNQYVSSTGVVAMPLTKFAETFGGHIDGHIHPIIENETISFVNPDEITQL